MAGKHRLIKAYNVFQTQTPDRTRFNALWVELLRRRAR